MKKIILTLSVLLSIFVFNSCDTKNDVPDLCCFEAAIIELDAQGTVIMTGMGPVVGGDYTKFSFSDSMVVDGDNWDVAFRSTSIIVNGGIASDTSQPTRTGNAAVYIADGIMDDITSVDVSLLLQDTDSSTAIIDDFGSDGNGGPGIWYEYSNQTVTPNAGKIFVFRTHDDKYVKMEILNFYDTPVTNQYGGFYTFNYELSNTVEF